MAAAQKKKRAIFSTSKFFFFLNKWGGGLHTRSNTKQVGVELRRQLGLFTTKKKKYIPDYSAMALLVGIYEVVYKEG